MLYSVCGLYVIIVTIAVLCRAVKSDYMYFCRNGFVTKEDYLTFMISRETENVDSAQEVEEAFKAITDGGDKPFVTESQLQQVKGSSYVFDLFFCVFNSITNR